MESNINLREFLHYLWSKIYIVIIAIILSVGVGELYSTYLKTPLYSATTEIVILSEGNKTLSNNDVLLSNNLVNTYSEIVKSQNVLTQVINQLHLNYSPDELLKKTTVSHVTGTQLINIKVSDPDPATSEKIANQLAQTFKKEIKNIYNLDNVQIVDQATLPTAPYNVNIIREAILYFAIGLASGIGIVLLIFLLDNTVKDSQSVEDLLELNVIGVIPNVAKR